MTGVTLPPSEPNGREHGPDENDLEEPIGHDVGEHVGKGLTKDGFRIPFLHCPSPSLRFQHGPEEDKDEESRREEGKEEPNGWNPTHGIVILVKGSWTLS